MRNDEEIRDDIIAELEWDPKIESTEIGVTVKEGAVSLMGVVGSYAEKLAAEQAAKRVRGVRAIAEEIKVRLPSDRSVTDEDIAERIAHVLEWNTSVPESNIQAEVRNGFVTLTGDVEWNYQRESAKDLIAGIKGVSAVSNMIKVRSRIVTSDITREITRALQRNAELEATKIKVEVDGSRVTLNGDVKAWYERKLVEDAVWAAPGVTQVTDNLRVA